MFFKVIIHYSNDMVLLFLLSTHGYFYFQISFNAANSHNKSIKENKFMSVEIW